jgi:hypothetical protein
MFVSASTRLSAQDSNATQRPSALIAGFTLTSFPCTPPVLTLTRVVVPVWRSCTNTSSVLLLSSATRLLARDSNATQRPSALIDGPLL